MAVLLASNVQGSPFTIPVEGDALVALVETVQFVKVVVLDGSGSPLIEKAKGNLILGIGLG